MGCASNPVKTGAATHRMPILLRSTHWPDHRTARHHDRRDIHNTL